MLNRSKLWAVGLLLAVFAAGGALGAAASAAWGEDDNRDEGQRSSRDDRSRHGSYAERLEAHLDLSQEQRTTVDSILAQRQLQVRELWAEYRPRFDTLRLDVRNQIMEILNDEQKETYQELTDRSDRRRDRESERQSN